ncbi:E3 ubiquitin-protein ligase AMFR-like [Hylaeus anthracinus]|uniref:E3 ubiquitin-protein ligase AMFR-like n=1 Tax=Hylaeus anthracinus TaxID=313031 RepID=UPI0023B97994|nr:E3 ubiquitin-protein ligase AMFR-like [Hylaeus anthracinus]
MTARQIAQSVGGNTNIKNTLINMAYCVLILLGKSIQKLVFGELRASERQHLKDKFWNFVFYKFIFLFGVLNVQYMDEVVLWWAWFTALGFLSLLSQLCKDRFEYGSMINSLILAQIDHFNAFSKSDILMRLKYAIVYVKTGGV